MNTKSALAIFLFFFLFLSAIGNIAHGQSSHDLHSRLQAANQLYSEGQYEQAITQYSMLIAEYGLSAELLHNLANSYAGNGENGQAILNYLRGLRLSPGDDDLRGDLDMIRKNIGMFSEEPGLREQIINLLDINQWCLLALAAYILLSLMVLLHYFFRGAKWLRSLIFVNAVLIVIGAYGAYQQKIIWSGGVIVSPQTRLLMSPFSTAPSLGNIDEGSVVFSEKRYNDFHYIRDSRGRAGWVEMTSYEKINTSHLIYSQDNAAQ